MRRCRWFGCRNDGQEPFRSGDTSGPQRPRGRNLIRRIVCGRCMASEERQNLVFAAPLLLDQLPRVSV